VLWGNPASSKTGGKIGGKLKGRKGSGKIDQCRKRPGTLS